MSYVLDPALPPGRELARVIHEQIEKLVAMCGEAGTDQPVFVHQARVRCKRIRGALRLARPLMQDKAYKQENRWWRDAARGLSRVRDLSARLEALDALKPFLMEEVGGAATNRLEARFLRDRAAFARNADDGAVAGFCKRVWERPPFEAQSIAEGQRDDVSKALATSYGDARRAMREALEERTPELAHEWRKRTKYHALQMRLSRRTFPLGLEHQINAARELAHLLGQVQDIEVMLQALGEEAESGVRNALESRRRHLMDEARGAGELLFGLKRKRWAKSATGSEQPAVASA